MGYEYRLLVEPPITDLAEACDEVFAASDWKRIATCFTDRPDGIGVQHGETPMSENWPQVADLCIEDDGQIYVLCHNQNGGLFMNALVKSLEATGKTVTVDDDI